MAGSISRPAKVLWSRTSLFTAVFFLLCLLGRDVIYADVIFEDNFDNQDDWTITQPTSTSENCVSNCDVPTGWTGYRNGFSYCNGGPGYNNIYLNEFIGYPSETSERGRGGGGKALTFWDESCCNFFEDSDGMLAVDLEQEYQELYIRFFIKFGHTASNPETPWQLGYLSSGTGSHKFLHVQHYLDGNPWSYFNTNEGNQPVFVANFKHWNDWYEATGTGRCFCGNGGGEDCYYCGGTPSGSGGFSGRVGTYNWYDNGAIGDGNWHCVEWRLKMNTYDEVNETFQADGIMQFWHDGILYLEKTNIPWNQNGAATNPIRGFKFISLGGNNQNRWISNCTGTECEQWYAIDDVVISTEYIGPDYVIGQDSDTEGEPVLHFCDITSGPKSGNTDGMVSDHGAIVTIWGNNLGSSQGTSKVYLKDSSGNIHEAAHIYYWVNADGLSSGGPADLHTSHKMQEVAFSIPVAAADGLGKIFTTVNGVNSNELDFTVREGGIYFVKTTGNNSTGDGSWLTPWQTIDFVGEGAGGTLDAGDIIYVCDAVIETGGTGIKISGASTAPLALVAYPDANAEITGLINNSVTVANWYQSHGYWVFSKLLIDTEATGMNPFTDMRVVGVEITGPNSNGYGGSIAGSEVNAEAVDGTCGGGKFYGLYIHDFGNDQTSEFHHTTYISNRDGLPNKAYEYGWCYLRDNKAVHGFHIYDQSPFGDWIGVMKIHDNVVVNQKGPAVNLMGGPGITVPLDIYNNIFINCGIGPDIDGWSVPKYAINLSDAVSSPVKIYNNLIYGYGDGSGCAINKAFSGTVDYKNNIIVDTKNLPYFSGSPDTNSNNLYYDGGDAIPAVPTWAVNPIILDPLFVDSANGNFQLQSTSPAIDAGSSDAASTVTRDLEGTARPQGSGYDIGAYEYISATLTGDLNNDGNINILDIQLCANVVLGVETDPDLVAKADVNNDGNINVLDVQEIVNITIEG